MLPRCVKVPVELKISPKTVAAMYNSSPSRPDCSLDVGSHRPASVSGSQCDVSEHAADISGLSRDATEEGQGQGCHPINDKKLAAAEIVDSCTSSATGITSPLPHMEESSSDGQKYLATTPNISLKLNSKTRSNDELLSVETLTASLQRSFSMKQTPSSESRSF